MTAGREEEPYAPLLERRLGQGGLHVKLDKGFEQGTYCVYVEFDDLASRTGFAAACRKAGEYCSLLKDELGRLPGLTTGATEDASRTGDAGRKRDLETTFLSFPIETSDGRFRDDPITKQFRLAFLRAGQEWDQAQARAQSHRRHARQEQFRQQLDLLLHGEAYAELGATVKERLLAEIPALAFPRRQIEP